MREDDTRCTNRRTSDTEWRALSDHPESNYRIKYVDGADACLSRQVDFLYWLPGTLAIPAEKALMLRRCIEK
jgi:hypothetical protein